MSEISIEQIGIGDLEVDSKKSGTAHNNIFTHRAFVLGPDR